MEKPNRRTLSTNCSCVGMGIRIVAVDVPRTISHDKVNALVIANGLFRKTGGPGGVSNILGQISNRVWRRRSALVITKTELKLMAAAAMTGLSSRPKNGYRTPAANGTPRAL